MVNIYGFPYSLKQTFIRSLLTSILAVMGVMGGDVPEFSTHSPLKLSFGFSAYTQDFNQSQIDKYAKAVLEIETRRQTAYQQIQKIIDRTPPNIICNQPDSFKELPRNAQTIAVNYCNESKAIVQNSGLTVSQFNEMTNKVRSDQELKRRVQNAMIRLRKKS
jgi:ABC-type transport system substrate-binding protein